MLTKKKAKKVVKKKLNGTPPKPINRITKNPANYTPYTQTMAVYVTYDNDMWTRKVAKVNGWSRSRLVDDIITKARLDADKNTEPQVI